MAQRYNPPPNWPKPPEGWAPPPGWQPDPAWGPAPAGWQVWLDEPSSAATAAYPPAAAVPVKKRHRVRNTVGAVVVLVIIIVIIASASSGGKKKPGTTTASNGGAAPAAVSSSPTSASASTPTQASSPAQVASPTPPPVTYSGSGAKVVTISKPGGDKAAVIAVIKNTGGSANFIVTPLDANLQASGILVNTIGNYAGTVLLDADGSTTHSLQVQSDGTWTITLASVLAARPLAATGTTQGNADDVLFYRGGAQVANLKFTGTGNFIVDAYGSDGLPNNLTNQIGAWSGQVPLPKGPEVIVVQANGDLSSANAPWTIGFGS